MRILLALISCMIFVSTGWCIHIPRNWYVNGGPEILEHLVNSTSTFLLQVSKDEEDVKEQSTSRYSKIYICYSGVELYSLISKLKRQHLTYPYQVCIVKWEGEFWRDEAPVTIPNFGLWMDGFVCQISYDISVRLYDKNSRDVINRNNGISK